MAGRRGCRQGYGLEGSVLYGWAMIFPIPAIEGSLVHVGDVQFRTAAHSVTAQYGAIAAPPWCVFAAARCETQATKDQHGELFLRISTSALDATL
jgi:hypothetical protein